MLKHLKRRWKIQGVKFFYVICTFALGGSLCGFLGRKILELTQISGGAWLLVYIIVVTLLWPMCILLISIPFGQFNFFKKYLIKIRNKMIGSKINAPSLIAIFASGAGSNAKKIIDHFENSDFIQVVLIVCNKPEAGVMEIAKQHNIDTLIIERNSFFNDDAYVSELKRRKIDFIVLAGFLWKIPTALIQAYPNKIINIHPALLPKYGGKGMYGNFVHEAVVLAGETESGITIHYVDEHYDHGNIIFQATCPIVDGDTASLVAQKIHVLEHLHYPSIIEDVLKSKIAVKTAEVLPQHK